MEVIDILGKVCLTHNINSKDGTETIHLTTLKDGVYFVRIKEANGSVTTAKFIKQANN